MPAPPAISDYRYFGFRATNDHTGSQPPGTPAFVSVRRLTISNLVILYQAGYFHKSPMTGRLLLRMISSDLGGSIVRSAGRFAGAVRWHFQCQLVLLR